MASTNQETQQLPKVAKMRNFKMTQDGIELTTSNAASSHGIPVLVVNGVAFGPADDIKPHLSEDQENPFDFLCEKITAADWVFDNLAARHRDVSISKKLKADQASDVISFLGDCQHCSHPSSRWHQH